MIKTYFKSTTAITLVCLVFLSVPIIHGQTQSQRQAEGIDLILVIDESGSMGGYGEHPQPNDPHNKRNELLHIILPYIVESAYRGNVFRISVVEFGSRNGKSARWQPKVTLSMYKIQEPNTGESRSDYLQRVSAELAHLRKDRTRGYSDHGSALALVSKEIKDMGNAAVLPPMGQMGVISRLKVIFLITDGMPYVRGKNGTPLSAALLKREIKDAVKKFPAQDAILFAFGLNDADKYWDDMGYGNFWDDVAATTSDDKKNRGHAQFVSDHKKILEQILPVLTRYTNPPGLKVINGNTFDCPPYLKSLQFVVEFPRSYMTVAQAVEIIQPDKTPLNTANANEMKVNAYIDIPYPIGGIWRFKRKDPDVKLLVKKTYEKVTFLSPHSPIHMRSTHDIKFKAFGPGPNNSFVLSPDFPLQPRLIIRTPQNTKDNLNAVLDINDPGVFVSKTPYQFQASGEYIVEFEASGISGAGSPLVVLRASPEKIQVTNSTPLEIEMEEPGGKVHTSFANVNQEFCFGFYTDGGKKKVPLQDILNTNDEINAVIEVMDASSNLLIKRADFKLTQKNGSLGGTVKVDLAFMETLKILTGKRTAKVTIEFDQRHVKDSYFLVVPQTQTRLYEFQRKLGEGFLVYLIIVLILLIILVFVIGLLYLFSKHECSKDIPELIYRQESALMPDDSLKRSITVDEPKKKYKHGDIGLNVPESTELWKPELIIKRNCIDQGVSVTVKYEKFGKTPDDRKNIFRVILEKLRIKQKDESKERFRTIPLQTRFPVRPSIHRIEELKDVGMIFELKIKGK
jgi:hypothetical protein